MAMYQVYDALRGLTDECVSVYLGDILVYSLTMAARRTHLWMVLDWMLESRLHVCARVSDFWSVRCHCECVLALDCGFPSLLHVALGSPRTTRTFMYRRRWPAAPSLGERDASVGGPRCCYFRMTFDRGRVRLRVDGVVTHGDAYPL